VRPAYNQTMLESRRFPPLTFSFSLALSCLLLGCSASQQPPVPKSSITSHDALAVSSRVVDCEWKAAARYDDGRSTESELAQQIMTICAVEILDAERAFHLSPHDPDIAEDELKQARQAVEDARNSKVGAK
jgi:hypothetical protein